MIAECFWCRSTKPLVKWSIGGSKFMSNNDIIIRAWCAECTKYLKYQTAVESYDCVEDSELELLRRSL